MYICVFMYKVYMCIDIYIYIYTHTYTHLCVHLCMYVYKGELKFCDLGTILEKSELSLN